MDKSIGFDLDHKRTVARHDRAWLLPKCSFPDLRKSYCTNLAGAVPLHVVQELAGHTDKRANGQRVGTVPSGHNLADDGVTLIENPAEQTVIQDIRAMRSAGKRLKQIAETPTERGVPTKTGKSDRWTHQAIARILNR